MAVILLIVHIRTTGIQNSETAGEVPQGISDVVLGQDVQHIAEPFQKHVMRSLVIATAFAAMDPDSLFRQIDPRFVMPFQLCSAPLVSVSFRIRPDRQLELPELPPDLPEGEVELILLYERERVTEAVPPLSPLCWPTLDGGKYLGGTLRREEIYDNQR